MKKCLFFWGWIAMSLCAKAELPVEWEPYTGSDYLYYIQSEDNSRRLPESEFKNYLVDAARTQLARQIETRIIECAQLNKQSVDGYSSVEYSSNTAFSTQLDLKLVDTKVQYDAAKRKGDAIVYIHKPTASNYYLQELNRFLRQGENSLVIARNYIQKGFKSRAKDELNRLSSEFKSADEAFAWLGFLGVSQQESLPLFNSRNQLELTVKNTLSDLQHSTVIYLSCQATLFGKPYAAMQNTLKGVLSREGCSFTTDPKKADWVIRITVSSREYNKDTVYGQIFYYAYADAAITVDKCLTSQRIYENEVSEKGGHSVNFNEAALKAYKNLCNQLGEAILETIK